MSDPKVGVELWDVEKLIPYALNAKKHDDEQVERLAKLIKKFGWTQPIVVDADGVIIAGHGRRLAAISLGMKKVPVVCRADLSKEEADALRLADNRAASTEYDMNKIQEEIARLNDIGFEIEFTGFNEKELEFLTDNLADMNLDLIVEDIPGAVETQKDENTQKANDVDASAAPIADAFGFKHVTVAESRIVRAFMSKIEEQTGKKGAAALVEYISKQD